MNIYKATPKKHQGFIRFATFVCLFAIMIAVTGFTASFFDLTTQVKGILPIANGGTASGTATGTGSVVLATSPTITTPLVSGDLGSNLGLGSNALLVTITNDTVTGTTANLLVKLSSAAPSKVILTGTGDTSGIVGICLVNCTTSGSAGIAVHGTAGCTADNSITAGDYVVEGTTTAGRCKSIGASPITNNQIIGRSLTTTSAASTATIMIFGQDIPDTAAGINFATVPETPSGALTGTSFTLAHSPSPAGSLILTKNGQVLTAGGIDYTLSGATITTVTAPGTGNTLTAQYYTF